MSRVLPDTHLLLWIAEDSIRMPAEAAAVLKDEENEIFFSVASIWEVSIKAALNKPGYLADPSALRRGLLGIGFRELLITSAHVIAVAKLPHHHRDPFDRLLVAQARTEGLTLMTTDKTLARYGASVRRFR
ncbi:PIN domain nuclease, a component of toxin-antitoxin system (PIN domain) [Bryocella elongata]|uniref:PIN domain nuclease, a component of toxin-antitoxin system (PIN domain) n=1 Tax=Bryocella elongata TaxID=863522 RepID=A0A1H6A826_9BACT|nr:type II toxin-antitoxin system VapC family toxin [Bryocella elongata]SEG44903.1 PIN domain nuclease, a component of toxin-antitoxin system (PIN domain) [Bryocella elongata]